MPNNIDQIIAGYHNFRNKYFNGTNKLFDTLKDGQSPKSMVIACSDSRVDPSIIMNCKPGDLFIVRNVANLVPPYENDDQTHHGTSAALEFGVCSLEVENIIILGHSKCGGINALIESSEDEKKSTSFITKWIEIAKPARKQTLEKYNNLSKEDKVEHCSRLSVVNSAKNLMTFPWIKERVENKKLEIHSWHFNIEFGKIQRFNPELQEFEDLG